MKRKIDIYNIPITIITSSNIECDRYAWKQGNIIIVTYNTPPNRFMQILLHEIIHIVNDKFYVSQWGVINQNNFIEFIDEQTAVTSEITLDILFSYYNTLEKLTKEYTKEYNKFIIKKRKENKSKISSMS